MTYPFHVYVCPNASCPRPDTEVKSSVGSTRGAPGPAERCSPVPALAPSVESALAGTAVPSPGVGAVPGMYGRYVIFDPFGANCRSCSSGLIASRSG